jgi:outer membrane lipopolysaccharide assembly protein LptE/RlpB
MKTRKNLVLFVGLLTILVLSACGSQVAVTTEAPVVVQPTEVEVEETVETVETVDLSQLSDAEMEAFILEKADGNHELEFILSQEMSAEEWSTTLDRMIGYGADISPEEKEAIIEWLVNR